MATVKLTGAIHTIFPDERYGNFQKKVFWLKEPEGKIQQTWSLELWHDDTLWLQHYKLSEMVECTCEVIGRSWSKNGKDSVINLLRCVEIKKL